MSKSSRRRFARSSRVAGAPQKPELSIAGLVAVGATLSAAPGALVLAIVLILLAAIPTPAADSPLPLVAIVCWLGAGFLSTTGLIAGLVDAWKSGRRISPSVRPNLRTDLPGTDRGLDHRSRQLTQPDRGRRDSRRLARPSSPSPIDGRSGLTAHDRLVRIADQCILRYVQR